MGPKRVLFMDEISTGLDSSTTYAIIKFLRDVSHSLSYTVAIALLQPAPETYDLFDDILLIAEGYLVYHGPREHVLDFFEPLGFRCPDRKVRPSAAMDRVTPAFVPSSYLEALARSAGQCMGVAFSGAAKGHFRPMR